MVDSAPQLSGKERVIQVTAVVDRTKTIFFKTKSYDLIVVIHLKEGSYKMYLTRICVDIMTPRLKP